MKQWMYNSWEEEDDRDDRDFLKLENEIWKYIGVRGRGGVG